MKAGDIFRCKWSKLALRHFAQFAKNPKRQGIAWPHRTDPDCVRVKWPGYKRAVSYHKSFIDRVGRP